MLASKRDCHGGHMADRPCRSHSPLVLGCSGLSCASARPHPTLYHTCETVNAIDAPRRVGLSRGAQQHRVGDRGTVQTLASKRRPRTPNTWPTHSTAYQLSQSCSSCQSCQKNTPIAAPGRAHFDHSFPILLRLLVSCCLRYPVHVHSQKAIPLRRNPLPPAISPPMRHPTHVIGCDAPEL